MYIASLKCLRQWLPTSPHCVLLCVNHIVLRMCGHVWWLVTCNCLTCISPHYCYYLLALLLGGNYWFDARFVFMTNNTPHPHPLLVNQKLCIGSLSQALKGSQIFQYYIVQCIEMLLSFIFYVLCFFSVFFPSCSLLLFMIDQIIFYRFIFALLSVCTRWVGCGICWKCRFFNGFCFMNCQYS